MGLAILSHAKVNCFQGGIIILTQIQEVLWLDIPNEDIASMALCHCPHNLTHRLGSICKATALHYTLPLQHHGMLKGQKIHES